MTDARKLILGKIKDDDAMALHRNFRKYLEVILNDTREQSDSCAVSTVLKNQGAIAVLKSMMKDLEPAREKRQGASYTGGFGE